MAGFLHPDVKDDGLQVLTDAPTKRLDLCTTMPTNLTEATVTHSKANKTGIVIGAPEAAADDARQVPVSGFTGGAVTGSGLCPYGAITDGTRLLVAFELDDPVTVDLGGGSNTFSIPAGFNIVIPDIA